MKTTLFAVLASLALLTYPATASTNSVSDAEVNAFANMKFSELNTREAAQQIKWKNGAKITFREPNT